MTAVMQGIRVLEVAEHTFVPAASAILSDWGADVIKIEPAERGDAMRGIMSSGNMRLDGGAWHPLLQHSNRGKRSIGLDLSTAEGVDILYKLAATCDVFLTNKLPAVRSKLRIDVEDIRAVNDKIVYVRGTGFGSRGPEADRGGYDVLGYWCRAGVAYGAKPVELDAITAQPAPAYGDSIGAMTIAGGISAALLHRERTGEAPIVDVSLLATGMWAMGAAIALSHEVNSPWGQFPVGTDVGNPLTASYRTSDGHWLQLACLQGFHYWADACRVTGLSELVDDERFADPETLAANSPTARAILAERFATAPMDEWKQRLADFRGQWSPVQDPIEVKSDPQVVANGYIVEAESSSGDKHPLVATPVQFDQTPSPTRRAPDFNEHGDAILTDDLGMDWDDVIELKVKGVVA
ncbi:CaiB/BaiF CoA transferase family protein [Mycolicibacterium moriokaense]|uniref:Crotonobetainyl-CoA:carnitine CoA-transferase CaiB-like acyl-CoA transferase n=1 Tax=Mycolicibacterium moriokaense TaxID=39691 RepID=A0A318HD63_9MYCO|nr:CoA transferase [Mycolicibacterium moriokaense]PXX01621.1 crotonobetainyl-CoA:carnitine CoA-transferase CaiB-like acyl-CoA transferase [Mycolicibacterium moriokaense]